MESGIKKFWKESIHSEFIKKEYIPMELNSYDMTVHILIVIVDPFQWNCFALYSLWN